MLGAQFFWFMFILFLVRGTPCSGTCLNQQSSLQCMQVLLPLQCSAILGCSLAFAQHMTRLYSVHC